MVIEWHRIYEHKVIIDYIPLEQIFEVEDWLEEYIEPMDRSVFHGVNHCFSFKNVEDAVAFKIRWI